MGKEAEVREKKGRYAVVFEDGGRGQDLGKRPGNECSPGPSEGPAYPSQASNLLPVREYIRAVSRQYTCGNLLHEQ